MKIEALGIGVDHWRFCAGGSNVRVLAWPALFDVISAMNFGVILGSPLAAGPAGRFAHNESIRLGSAIAAVFGRLPMSYVTCHSAATSGRHSVELLRAACKAGSGSSAPFLAAR